MNNDKHISNYPIKVLVMVVICFAIFNAASLAQEVIVEDFPIGIGGSVSPDFFKPYYSQLAAIADTLASYPMTRAVVTGGADGEQFRKNSDAMNPALALGRAHALSNLLISRFGVDSSRIIVQSEDAEIKGSKYRHATVRVNWELDRLKSYLDNVASRLEEVAQRPPIEKQTTIVQEVQAEPVQQAAPEEVVGLRLGAGLSSSPFGGIPIVSAAIAWERTVFIEAVFGHTFWSGSIPFNGIQLDTKRRIASGQIVVRPLSSVPVSLVGGWLRAEEIAPDYNQYAKMTEGPVLGLRVMPYDFVSVTGLFHPAQERTAGDQLLRSRTNKILLSMTFHLDFGGEK